MLVHVLQLDNDMAVDVRRDTKVARFHLLKKITGCDFIAKLITNQQSNNLIEEEELLLSILFLFFQTRFFFHQLTDNKIYIIRILKVYKVADDFKCWLIRNYCIANSILIESKRNKHISYQMRSVLFQLKLSLLEMIMSSC